MKVLDIPSTGKRGMIVAYPSPYGQCQRAYGVPKNTLTEARSRVRIAFGTYARGWSKVLTQPQRDAWDAAGPHVKTAKRLTAGHFTGQLLYQSINFVRACVGQPTPLLYPPEPVVFSPNPVGKLDITNGEDGVRLFVNLSSRPTEDIMVYGQAPCSAGRRKRRRVAYLGLLTSANAGPAEITALYTARFGEPAVGEKVFIVTRQEKDGWQAFEHETSEIVPPKPPTAQGFATEAVSRLETGAPPQPLRVQAVATNDVSRSKIGAPAQLPTAQAVVTEGVSRLEISAPPPPRASQATATPALPDSSVVYTGCTPVAQRIAWPPVQDRDTTGSGASAGGVGADSRFRAADGEAFMVLAEDGGLGRTFEGNAPRGSGDSGSAAVFAKAEAAGPVGLRPGWPELRQSDAEELLRWG